MNQHAAPIVCSACGLEDEVWVGNGLHRTQAAFRLGWTKRRELLCPRCSSHDRYAVRTYAEKHRAWGPSFVEIARARSIE